MEVVILSHDQKPAALTHDRSIKIHLLLLILLLQFPGTRWPTVYSSRAWVRRVLSSGSSGPFPVPQSAPTPPTSLTSSVGVQFSYYVDSQIGKDSNAGTLAAPWQTIAKVNATKLTAGQSVGFKRGATWRETLDLSSRGTAAAPIIMGAYGTGAAPIISGADVVSHFVAEGGANIWKAEVPIRPGAVWIDGKWLGPPGPSQFGLLNQNEWFWSSGVFYIYSPTNPASGHILEVADRNYAAYITSANYLILTDLELKGGNTADVYVRQSAHITLENSVIHDTVGQGVYLGISGGGHTIQNSTIFNTGFSPILGRGSAIQTDNALTVPSIFQNNYIYHIGMSAKGDHGVYDQSPGDTIRYNTFYDFPSSGVKMDANGGLIYDNVFNSIPMGGVYLDAYSNVRVLNNTFYNVGTVSPYGGIVFNPDGRQTGVEFKNNIFYISGREYSIAIVVNANSTSEIGFSSDHNDVFGAATWWGEWQGVDYESLSSWRGATKQDVHSIASDPLFVNSAIGDFTVRPGSGARDSGLYIPGLSKSDPPSMGSDSSVQFAPERN